LLAARHIISVVSVNMREINNNNYLGRNSAR